MTGNKKNVLCAALIAAMLTSSGCTDISGVRVNVYTPPVQRSYETEAAEPEEESDDEAEDDEELETADPEGFVTTGGEKVQDTTESGTGRAAKNTTFPIQTTPEVLLTAETIPAETGAETTAPMPVQTTAEPVTSAAPAQTSANPPSSNESINYNVIGQNGILVSYQNGHYRGIMACFGTYTLCEGWADAVNKFAEKLPDARVYSMTVPIASEFYTPQSFWDSGFTVSQYNKCEHIRENLSGAVYVDAYTALSEHTAEDIYSRTDHHWTPLGAYYAAEQFAKKAGIEFPPLSEYSPVSRSGYVGSMYTYSKDVHLYNDSETFTMYLSPNADRISTTYYNTDFGGAYDGDLFVSRTAASFYCSFLGSDDRIAHVHTDVGNGRTLVVFKQSYGNALIPFLTSGFEDIYVCDMRYFGLNGVQFCKDVGATDVLCTDCVMIAAGNGGRYLEAVLNN